MKYKIPVLVGGGCAALLLLISYEQPTPEPTLERLSTAMPAVQSETGTPVEVPAFAPAYVVNSRGAPVPKIQEPELQDNLPVLAVGEGDAVAQERNLKRMMRGYDGVRAYPEQRQAYRDEMAARLEAYSAAIAPVALAKVAAYQQERLKLGEY